MYTNTRYATPSQHVGFPEYWSPIPQDHLTPDSFQAPAAAVGSWKRCRGIVQESESLEACSKSESLEPLGLQESVESESWKSI